jgi:hypothetical protein
MYTSSLSYQSFDQYSGQESMKPNHKPPYWNRGYPPYTSIG